MRDGYADRIEGLRGCFDAVLSIARAGESYHTGFRHIRRIAGAVTAEAGTGETKPDCHKGGGRA